MSEDGNGQGGSAGGNDGDAGGQRRRRRRSRSRKRKSPEEAGAAPVATAPAPAPAPPPARKPPEGPSREPRPPRRQPVPRPSRPPASPSRPAPPRPRPAEDDDARERPETDYLLEREDRGDFRTMDAGQLTFLKPHEIDEEVLLDDLPEADFDARGVLLDVVGVKLHPAGVVTACECEGLHIEKADPVIVETGRGLALGEAVVPSTRRLAPDSRLPRVIRKASLNDMRQRDRNIEKERAAFALCREQIAMQKLQMKLIGVDYLHGGNKAVFYFASEGRVDFRDLVRDMARRLHIRVEMRQIGVRDAARMLGGIGGCGQPLCCNRYLREFTPVSIRMAKNQDLVLNPEKVSGVCGRLLCCLSYEDAHYKEASKNMPKVGRRVITPEGEGRVRDRDVLRRIVRVHLADGSGLREFPVDQVSPAAQPGAPGKSVPDDGNDPAQAADDE